MNLSAWPREFVFAWVYFGLASLAWPDLDKILCSLFQININIKMRYNILIRYQVFRSFEVNTSIVYKSLYQTMQLKLTE